MSKMPGQTQTRDSQGFNPPPLALPLEYVPDFHLEENPDHVVLTHPIGHEKGFKSYTYKEIVPAIHRAGQAISEFLNLKSSFGSVPPVVAVILKTDTMTYITAVAGLMRAGITAFPISHRFSSTVVAHLLKESRPVAVIVNDATRELVSQSLQEYTSGNSDRPLLCDLPPFSSLYPGNNIYTPLSKHERKPDDVSIILHSSSTSSTFPKLISWSSAIISHHGEINDMPLQQLAGKVLGCFELELFHSLSMCVLFTAFRRGPIIAIMDPAEKTSIHPVDINDVFHCFRAIQPDFLFTNARAIELWAEDPEKVVGLRDSSANIVFGGRFLNKTVGDRLVRDGVKICQCYGATECGPVALFTHFQGEDWEYWTVYPRPDINFVARGDGLIELIVAPTDELNYLTLVNTTWNGKPAFNPGDIFISHPTKPHTYKMLGRSSDQIMLATGETINPVGIEGELASHPLISSAVMFGHTRFRVGIVIEPVGGLRETQENDFSDWFLDRIWPSIEDINAKLPSYSQIAREMTVVAHPQKPISMSPKGLPRRPIVWLEYQDEIDALYAQNLRVPK